MLLGESTRSFRKEVPGFEKYFEFKVTPSSYDDGNCTQRTTDATGFKKVIPEIESQRYLSTANFEAGVSSSLQAPTFGRKRVEKRNFLQQRGKAKKLERVPVTQSEGIKGLIDSDVTSWTRKPPKMSETSLREIGPKTLIVLEGAETHSLKQTERLKAVRAAVWLEAKVRGFGWTPQLGLKKAVSFDRRLPPWQ